MYRFIIAFVITVAACCHLAVAQSYESIADLKATAKSFLAKQIGPQPGKISIALGHLDSRLRLTKCLAPGVLAYLPQNQSPIRTSTVGLRCENSVKPWTIYVPVRVRVLVPVVVANHPIHRGAKLSASHLKIVDYDAKRLTQGFFKQPKELYGYIVKQSIQTGKPITHYNIRAPQVVHRGERVFITAVGQGISVGMRGTALSSGRLGETIGIQTKKGGRVIQAQIVGQKHVQVVL